MQIWKDYIVEIGDPDADFVDYAITVDESLIYQGRAYRRPGELYCKVRMNDICADYLHNNLPSMEESTSPFPEKIFTITWLNGDGIEESDNVTFVADYSYQSEPTYALNAPIRYKLDERCPLFFAPIQDETDVTIAYKSGEVFSSTFTGKEVHLILPSAGEPMLKFGEYDIVPHCHRFSLYYSNAFGGWDSLIMEGNYKELDTLTRHERTKEYDNSEVVNRGRVNYVNEIVKSFELNTGWLSDDEASRMHHLINSTDVYLYDADNGEMIPVVLTSTTCEYKTIKAEGKAVNYAVQVEIAHNRVRR